MADLHTRVVNNKKLNRRKCEQQLLEILELQAKEFETDRLKAQQICTEKVGPDVSEIYRPINLRRLYAFRGIILAFHFCGSC